PASVAASAKKRLSDSNTGTPSGIAASSAIRTKSSAATRPPLMNRIDAILEGLDADALHGVDENLVGTSAQFDISGNDVLDHVRDLVVGHRRSDQGTELRVLVGLAAERDLVELLVVLLDAQDADMADMVMAAGIDAARNVDVEPADIALKVGIGEAPRDLHR